MSIYASFLIAAHSGGIAATTRAADRGEAGKIGLPGGKVDPGETSAESAAREATEEGWHVSSIDPLPCHVATVDGRQVAWHLGRVAGPLSEYAERGRIAPIVCTPAEVVASGYGNDGALRAVQIYSLHAMGTTDIGICAPDDWAGRVSSAAEIGFGIQKVILARQKTGK